MTAVAGTGPHWAPQHQQGTPAAAARNSDSRDINRGSTDNGKRNYGESNRTSPPRGSAQPNRGERRTTGDPRPQLNGEGAGRPGGNWQTDRHGDDSRNARDPRNGDGQGHRSTDWNRDRAHDRNDNRNGDPHWSGDHRSDDHGNDWNHDGNHDRSDNRNGDAHWSGDHSSGNHWRDDHGRDWRHDRHWYDHYRVNHYRYYGGHYFARQRFYFGLYYAPFPYYRARFWLGDAWLPGAYYDAQYVIGDYWQFDLYDPPAGCRWVRVGNDALLVDTWSGQVVDHVYDVFW
ncbi:MAG TPA: RcnB family protein [Steroidobacteraceae bacterium]|nr:RcnB family protein [Steroidobacteraceae bacterium]